MASSKARGGELFISISFTIAQLFGHTHADQWKVLSSFSQSNPTEGSYLLICPGITPNYQNNPAFRLMKYDEDAEVMFDYTQYFLDLAVANGMCIA